MPYGLELAQASGAQAAGNTINELTGLFSQPFKNKQQLKQARKLQDLGLEAEATRLARNESMALRMFENTGYNAQVEQMKKAGINPALLYGMSAGGGTTQAQAPQASGSGHAQTAQASRGSEGMGLMIGQMGLLQAQKENIEADTANKLASKPKTEAETEGIHLNNEFLKKSLNDRIDIINSDAAIKIADIDIREGERDEQRMSRTDRMNQIKAQAAGEILKNALITQQTKEGAQNIEESKARVIKMDAEIKNWSEQIAQGWKNLDIHEKEMKIKEFEALIKARYPGITNVIGGAANDVIEGLNKLLGGERKDQPKF